ncbi:dolichyl-phosphate-mannose--protein mannosyltransferase [Micrococcus sp.]|uniref:dolichyl-phosphate-mannose--protein mannosyltransferase n=1 Tax=Micrococcus sp. TaxID=1271 RepID=UPI002A90B2FD|nr:phospholipid carrier-dependent glycosyltransferase [Micrococcus sp.]MDY6055336.1 phospholipid carrier-dependent glycosyltransferase [Micrococcus sp.]
MSSPTRPDAPARGPRPHPFSVEGLRLRLGVEPTLWTRWHWIVPLAVTLVAGVLRFWNLGHPEQLIFDETYYPKDAYALLDSGYERQWGEGVDEAFARGEAEPLPEAAYVVHPPLGKWMIAVGMLVFGPDNGFGWRSSAALTGTLSVLLVALIAQHLFRSVSLGALAGLLTATEGHHLVMSRIGLLDMHLSFFMIAAFGALLLDRAQGRRLLAERLGAQVTAYDAGTRRADPLTLGPWLGWRPWRVLAGVLLGAGCAVKLSGLAFMAVFGLLTVLWDMEARRTAGIRRWLRAGVVRDGLPAFVAVVGVGAAVYLATWTGWFLSDSAYYRQWHRDNPPEGPLGALVPGPLRSLWHYHSESFAFHESLTSPHDYASSPWTWPFMGRPVSYYYEGGDPGQNGCPADAVEACSSAITDIANPFVWWTGLIAVLVCVAVLLRHRDWRAGALLGAYVAGQVVWFRWPDRTMFFFYSIAYEPFLILMIVLALSLLLRRGHRPGPRWGGVIVAAYLVVAVTVSLFFLPVWIGDTISYPQWSLRMWLRSWI